MTATSKRLASAAIRSADLRLPLWLRLVALAVERDQAGRGVASFKHGELRQILDVDGLELHYSTLTRAIHRAESYGFLGPGSSTRALIVVPGTLTAVTHGLER